MSSSLEQRYYRRKDAAAFLRDKFAIPTSTGHLAKLAVVGGGPAYVKFSRTPIYPEVELVRWAKSKLGIASEDEWKPTAKANMLTSPRQS